MIRASRDTCSDLLWGCSARRCDRRNNRSGVVSNANRVSDDCRGRRLRGDDRAGCIWRAKVATHTCDFGGDTALGLVERIGQQTRNARDMDFTDFEFVVLFRGAVPWAEADFVFAAAFERQILPAGDFVPGVVVLLVLGNHFGGRGGIGDAGGELEVVLVSYFRIFAIWVG